MNLYILRHGQTDYNLLGKFQGQIDIELNTTGIKQALKTKQSLENVKFDISISSPLKRALQTANLILEKAKIQIDNRIIERSFGTLEGKFSIPDFEEKSELYQIESFFSLCDRVYSFLDNVIKNYSDKDNILIITHECVAQVIETYFNKNITISNWKQFRLNNADYKKYVI